MSNRWQWQRHQQHERGPIKKHTVFAVDAKADSLETTFAGCAQSTQFRLPREPVRQANCKERVSWQHEGQDSKERTESPRAGCCLLVYGGDEACQGRLANECACARRRPRKLPYYQWCDYDR
jgi:hypothetical protein